MSPTMFPHFIQLTRAAALLVCGFVLPSAVWAQGRPGRTTPPTGRTPLPTFADGAVKGVFFDNVFKDALAGDRPASLGVANVASSTGGSPTMASDDGGSGGGEDEGTGWAAAVSATAIEDEIKQINLQLNTEISTPTAFAGNGYRVSRQAYSILSAMFGIAAEYNGDIRLKDKAAAARDHFARTAAGSKVGTPQAYDQAKKAHQDLQDLLNGGAVELSPPVDDVDWSMIVERSPLMVRLDEALNKKLRAATSDAGTFKSESETVEHEAQIVSAISAILVHEPMPDHDATNYADWCKKMRAAAKNIVDGVKLNNYDQVRAAVGEISKQCDDCHGEYR